MDAAQLTKVVESNYAVIENYQQQVARLLRDLDRYEKTIESKDAEIKQLATKAAHRGEKMKKCRKQAGELVKSYETKVKIMETTLVSRDVADGMLLDIARALPNDEIHTANKCVSVIIGEVNDAKYFVNVYHKKGKRPGYKLYTSYNGGDIGLAEHDKGKLLPDIESLIAEIEMLKPKMTEMMTAEYAATLKGPMPGGLMEFLNALRSANSQ